MHRVLGSRVSKVNPSETVFWCRDRKLGISTQVLLPLYNVAKQTFMAALERYKMHSNLSVKKDEYGSDNMSSWYASSLDVLESEVMKHSRALLLLSCDFGTVWNSRKLVLSNKQHSQIFVDELLLSALVLSYAPKSECSWSHRDLADFRMGINPGPPITSREEFETRKYDLWRKRATESVAAKAPAPAPAATVEKVLKKTSAKVSVQKGKTLELVKEVPLDPMAEKLRQESIPAPAPAAVAAAAVSASAAATAATIASYLIVLILDCGDVQRVSHLSTA